MRRALTRKRALLRTLQFAHVDRIDSRERMQAREPGGGRGAPARAARTLTDRYCAHDSSIGARRATISAVVAGGLGLVMGAWMSIAGDAPGQPFDVANGPLPAGVAAALIAVIVLVLAPVTWFWHRNIDEHEEQSYRTGALVGLYIL